MDCNQCGEELTALLDGELSSADSERVRVPSSNLRFLLGGIAQPSGGRGFYRVAQPQPGASPRILEYGASTCLPGISGYLLPGLDIHPLAPGLVTLAIASGICDRVHPV